MLRGFTALSIPVKASCAESTDQTQHCPAAAGKERFVSKKQTENGSMEHRDNRSMEQRQKRTRN